MVELRPQGRPDVVGAPVGAPIGAGAAGIQSRVPLSRTG